MLRGISPLLSPDILKVICEMGHGDELVLADGNFPGYALGQRVISCAGHRVTHLLQALLPLFPLDALAPAQGVLMEVTPGDLQEDPPVWSEYKEVLARFEPKAKVDAIARQSFYERSSRAYLILQTGETALYGNLILRKGVVI